ncbi:MAG: hypothetical protein U0271_37800 [Polyangiaceae bacterium]
MRGASASSARFGSSTGSSASHVASISVTAWRGRDVDGCYGSDHVAHAPSLFTDGDEAGPILKPKQAVPSLARHVGSSRHRVDARGARAFEVSSFTSLARG